MSARTYPRDIWVLTPSYAVKKVTVVGAYRSYSATDYGDLTSTSKLYSSVQMHATKADAIAAGRASILKIQADIDKRLSNLHKKCDNLRKAAVD